MIIVTSIIAVLGMVFLPFVLGFWLTRKFNLPWRLWIAGAATFILSQVGHIPALVGLTALFTNGVLPSPPAAWTTAFNAVTLGLMAGIFEETARYVLFKFSLKNARTWNEGVLVGAGHGGIEAIFLGIGGILTIVNMIVMRNLDASMLGLSADQAALAKQQVDAFWASPAYIGLLGLIERFFAVCLHVALSVMVLYSVAYKKPIWFWTALLWHAAVDAGSVYLSPMLGPLATEGVVGGMAMVSALILFGLRPKFDVPNPPQVMVEEAAA